MNYKGYYGSFELDENAVVFCGKVEFIKALISYEASTARSLKKSFRDAVDDYLETCKGEGIQPEQPFKGSFNVRIGQELHRKLAVIANTQRVTLNKFVCEMLERAVMRLEREPRSR